MTKHEAGEAPWPLSSKLDHSLASGLQHQPSTWFGVVSIDVLKEAVYKIQLVENVAEGFCVLDDSILKMLCRCSMF